MDSAFKRLIRVWGTILIGLFVLFGSISTAYAQDEASLAPPENIPDVEEAFLDDVIAGEETQPEESVELVPPGPQPNPEKARYDSESTVSVKQIKDISVQLGVFGFLILMLLICISFLVREGKEYAKKLVFWSMVFVIVIPTIFFVASTIYVNVISATKGPVHWHADFRIYACGTELEPPEPPHKLSNKTGTSEVHQHEDKRLHIEGVLVDLKEGSLANFFEVQGGKLTENSFTVPHSGGITKYENGGQCEDGTDAYWSVFLYSVDSETNEVSKRKMDMTEVPDYVLSPYINVPPGDCLIFNYGEEIDDTDQICNFYQVAINNEEIFPTWKQ